MCNKATAREPKITVLREIFAGLNFRDFSNDPQKLITANIFPAKIYPRVNNI